MIVWRSDIQIFLSIDINYKTFKEYSGRKLEPDNELFQVNYYKDTN